MYRYTVYKSDWKRKIYTTNLIAGQYCLVCSSFILSCYKLDKTIGLCSEISRFMLDEKATLNINLRKIAKKFDPSS